MLRVVSLIASATEMVCALGLEEWLVGRSHECDFPASITALPVCTEAKVDAAAPSAVIDRDVKKIIAQALSVYRVDGEKLRQLQPDIILTQTQCEVCAVSLKDVEQAVCETLGPAVQIISMQAASLAAVWEDISRVAGALEVQERGVVLLEAADRRMQSIAATAAELRSTPGVACIEWIDPLMAAGNWVPELVEMAGGKNLFGEAGKHSPWMHWDQVVSRNPDVIVIMPCGFDMQRSRQEMTTLEQQPEWQQLHAVQEGRVFVTDGSQYFNRPGPRLIESLEILAEIFHPDTFHFGHENKGWQRL